jgi:hypothetical protein
VSPQRGGIEGEANILDSFVRVGWKLEPGDVIESRGVE